MNFFLLFKRKDILISYYLLTSLFLETENKWLSISAQDVGQHNPQILLVIRVPGTIQCRQ
jgi:hypothetical protein